MSVKAKRVKPVLDVPQKCLTEGCDGTKAFKGICRSCYGQALRLIGQGRTTWDELEEMGLIQLDDKPFTVEFKKLKAEIEKHATQP